MHRVALGHIAVVAAYQIRLDHLDGMQGQRIGKVAVRGGNVCLNGVGHGIHTGMGNQLFGHGVGQFRVDDGHIGGDLKVGDGILDALVIVGDDGERRHFRSRAGRGGDSAEMSFAAQRRDAEYLAHILKGDVRVFVFDPHRFGSVDGGTAADGDDPVGLEFLHGGRALHDGFHRRVGFDALKQGYLHTGFL